MSTETALLISEQTESLRQVAQYLGRIDRNIERIADALELQQAQEFRQTPDGRPICPRHGAAMSQREKQGDTWHSHKIAHPRTGEILYCRGYADPASPGWDIEPAGSTSATPSRPARRESKAEPAQKPADDIASNGAGSVPPKSWKPAGELIKLYFDDNPGKPATPQNIWIWANASGHAN